MKNLKNFISLATLGFIAYAVGLTALNLYHNRALPYRYFLILLPMMPTVYVVLISVRYVWQLDEMYRKIMTEAMAFAGLATALTCMGYNFCHDMGAPEFKAYWAWCMADLYFLAGVVWAKRRYR